MKIDNQRNTYRIWISRLVMAIVFTLAIIVILFLPWFEGEDVRISKYHLIIAIALVYIIINLVNYLKVPYFVSYSDQGEMIVLRYYQMSLFTSRKHSIEIPKKQFVKFELQDFLFGTQQKIILYQNFRKKVAKYPPISLSAVDKADRKKIIDSLSGYMTG
ncbi:MAG TPA: hypothetical protein ENO20_09915 [Bacteroides sp.]|nr:hypothetical protein [Bacteroides sp.]